MKILNGRHETDQIEQIIFRYYILYRILRYVKKSFLIQVEARYIAIIPNGYIKTIDHEGNVLHSRINF